MNGIKRLTGDFKYKIIYLFKLGGGYMVMFYSLLLCKPEIFYNTKGENLSPAYRLKNEVPGGKNGKKGDMVGDNG